MLVTAAILSGLASMPRRLTMLPSNIPDGTPKIHLVGFSFHRYTFNVLKTLVRSVMRVSAVLNYHIINVGLNILPDLVLETALDGSLISRSLVFETKRHGHVVVGAEGHDERCLDLVFFL